MTTAHNNATQTTTRGPAAIGLTQRRVIASEWIKLRSLRSTAWILAVAVLSIVTLGVFPAVGTVVANAPPSGDAGGIDQTGGALTGVSFAQLLVLAFGVLAVTNEYATGLIRATLSAVPTRLPVLWAKAVVVAAVTFLLTFAAVVAAFVTVSILLASTGLSISPTAPGVPRALVGAALYLTVTALLGIGFGWLLRNTAGAMAGLFGFLFALPLLGLFLPQINPYLPNNAGAAIMQTRPADGSLPPWIGFGVFAAYAAAVLTAAAVALTRRDT